VGILVPGVQAQDGSFVGSYQDGSGQTDMVAFDATGNIRWTIPNDQPQFATDDGGVVGQSGIKYDQNGSAEWQIPNLPTSSWLGNAYVIGSVKQLLTDLFYNLPVSFWPAKGGNPSGNGTAIQPITQAVRALVLQEAQSYVTPSPTSQEFLDTPSNQCNKFVQTVLQNAGAEAPLASTSLIKQAFARTRIGQYLGFSAGPGYPATAGDWAFPRTTMQCWHNVPGRPGEPDDSLAGGPERPPEDPSDRAQSGDVIAETIYRYYDATGHVGIVQAQQQTISADSAIQCVELAMGNNNPQNPGTIDVTDYGFRADNWVDPFKDRVTGQPCRLFGKKSSAVVKRFVCK
jgi:hypothetical protein